MHAQNTQVKHRQNYLLHTMYIHKDFVFYMYVLHSGPDKVKACELLQRIANIGSTAIARQVGDVAGMCGDVAGMWGACRGDVGRDTNPKKGGTNTKEGRKS